MRCKFDDSSKSGLSRRAFVGHGSVDARYRVRASTGGMHGVETYDHWQAVCAGPELTRLTGGSQTPALTHLPGRHVAALGDFTGLLSTSRLMPIYVRPGAPTDPA